MMPSRVPLRKKFLHKIDKNFEGYRNAAVGEKVRVSFPDDADDKINKINKKSIVAQTDLDKPPFLSPNVKDLQLQAAQAAASGPRTTGGYRHYRPSSRIDSLAKPLARWRKPLVRLSTVFREVDHQIPWSKKGPRVTDKKPQVFHQPPSQLIPRTKTGVSRAALKYEASEHIKRLAQHRPKPKVQDDEKKCFMVKPLSLIYKPSLRIQQLSKPRIRIEKTT